jgi:probable H4MPT-linked C1 transfer pathway protein
MTGAVIGFDIGGANVKAAHSAGACRTRPFPLWTDPDARALRPVLRELLRALPPADELAVTMTGELCDCFASKRDGVHHILDAVAAEAARPVHVWRSDGRLVGLAAARSESPLLVAAANWLALATWAGRLAPSGPALLVDIGSTTTDVIPLCDSVPVPAGLTDPERLRSGELVYTGVRRTPLCAVLGNDRLASEWFATTHDVYLALGMVPEDADDTDTADHRPAIVACAHARLARMFCADLTTSNDSERLALARRAHRRQVEQLGRAARAVVARLRGPPHTVILSGSGEFLARAVLADAPLECCRVVSLQEEMGAALSQAACAYAVAVLRAEQAKGETAS